MSDVPVSLREHLEAVIAANDKRYEERFAAQKEAVLKAETATEKRLEGLNELRGALGDQQRTFIGRSEVEIMRNAMTDRVNELKQRMDSLTAERAGIKGGWGYAVGMFGFVVAVIALLLKFK